MTLANSCNKLSKNVKCFSLDLMKFYKMELHVYMKDLNHIDEKINFCFIAGVAVEYLEKKDVNHG